MGIKTSIYGQTADGKQVTLVTAVNDNGMGMEVMDYGATLVAVTVPDQTGRLRDVVLGYDDVADYMRHGGYLGGNHRQKRKPYRKVRSDHWGKGLCAGQK